ncbi:ABC transporter substrate-binding protein [Desulfocucumis palustris]|uniref:ABC transporter substrate-binding protein n=1 Tax=Desulfocucumis palustris TaxID=1898651 RepID=A0A2L2XGQ5_9FIRM|nr:ABC transporter substrate-binding protein [Desulfocucumis palustris]GBF34903.1 ABC transporter substrate-binding protein [Desulfocucumis palustris]
MRNPVRPLFLLATLLLILGTLALTLYLLHDARREKQITIKVVHGHTGPYHLPYHLVLEKEFLKQENISIKSLNLDSEAKAMDTLLNGQADMAMLGLEEFIRAGSRTLDGDFDAVAFAAVSSASDTYLLAREQKGDFQWSGLKGKTVICGSPDCIETIILEEILRRNDLIPYENVTLITNIPDDLKIGALKAGIGNYLLVREPLASIAQKDGSITVVASPGREIGAIPTVICAVNKEYLSKHPETVQKFTNALYKSLIWIKYHSPEEIRDLRVKSLNKKDRELNAIMAEKYARDRTWPENPNISGDSFQLAVTMMSRAREIPREVSFEQLVDNSFAGRAVSTVEYIPEDKVPKRKFPLNILDKITGN